jgi:hypothetical protein
MTKRTRASRQQAARRRPQPRPGTPGGAPPRATGGGPGGSGGPAGGRGTPVEQDEDALNGAAAGEGDEDAAPSAPAAAARPAPASVGARRVGRVDPATAGRRMRPQQRQQAAFPPLDPEDPAIPFDRVPYVPADLRRVAYMAGLMIVLIVVAALVVTHTVGS